MFLMFVMAGVNDAFACTSFPTASPKAMTCLVPCEASTLMV